MDHTIGDLVDRAARARGWGDQRLAFEIGVLPSEKVFNATQVKRLRRGERQNLSRELVSRLIKVLQLPEEEAWHAAGIWPPDLSVEGYRQYRRLVGTHGNPVTAGYPFDTGHDPGQWPRRVERRRVERRRRPVRPVLVPHALELLKEAS